MQFEVAQIYNIFKSLWNLLEWCWWRWLSKPALNIYETVKKYLEALLKPMLEKW